MGGLTTLLLDNVGQLLELSLGSEKGTELYISFIHFSFNKETETYPLLGELPCLLVFRVPQQLHHSLLVWGETGNFSDNRLDESLLLAIESASTSQV